MESSVKLCNLTGLQFYEVNEDYRTYIDKVCVSRGITKEEAIELALSKETEKMYRDIANNVKPKDIYF